LPHRLDVALYDGDSHALPGEAKRALVVPSGDGPLNLPAIEMGLTVHRKMAGKPAPEIAATDLDTGWPVRKGARCQIKRAPGVRSYFGRGRNMI
jgi:hypothetical protein